MEKRFKDRRDAGRALAQALVAYLGRADALILALPRGGVPVAFEAAQALGLPLDVWLVRKLGVPGQEELAMGAIAAGGIRFIDPDIRSGLHVSDDALQQAIARESAELERRSRLYRKDRAPPDVRRKTAIVIDDGLATGATMHAAVDSLRQAGAARIVVAVPVGPRTTCLALRKIADEVVCLRQPEPFFGVGQWYLDFSQTADAEVTGLLDQCVGRKSARG